MAQPGGEEGLGGSRAASCAGCGAGLAADQRYCLECGERRGPLPAAVASWLSIVPSPLAEQAPAAEAAAAGAAEPDGEDEPFSRYMPEPRAAAVAVMALLAFGVVVGAFTGPAAESAGVAPIVLYSTAETAPTAPEPEEAAESEAVEPAPVTAPPPAEAPLLTEPPIEELPPPAPEKAAPEIPEEPPLPPITHVFTIVLADNGYETAFGEASPAPYLAKELREKGELLENYYAVARGDLANEIALVSGQGPNPATVANCPESKDVTPGTLDVTGQAQGEGCVYPAEVQALPDLLEGAKKTWKVYTEDSNPSWRDPFSFFHSLSDEPACADCTAGLDQLSTDLAKDTSTPSFSYIVAGACHDGSAEPCGEGQPAGLAASQPFLEAVVPKIMESDAYKKGGLIAITFA